MSFPSPPPHGPAPDEAAAYAQNPHPQPPYPHARVPYAHFPPRPGPVIDGKDLRPGTRWYWIGGLTIPIGGLVALLVFLGLLFSASAEPELIAEFEGGDSATFQVEEGQEGHWGLYVEGDANRYACELDTPSGPGTGNDNLDTAPYPHEGLTDDSWRLSAELSTPEPGEYVLRCDDLHSGTYGIGTLEQVASSETKLITGALALIVLGPLSLIAGVVVLVVTGARRSSHRARLVQEWMRGAGAPQGTRAEPSPGDGSPGSGPPGGPQH